MFDIKYKVDLKELEHLTKAYPEASLDARVAKITEVTQLLERVIKMKTPSGAGPIHLRDSIGSGVNVSGEKVSGFVGTPLQHGEPVEMGRRVDYGAAVEMGTRPHFPPIGPIQFWVEKKLKISDEKESRAVAFLIARAISKHGTKAQKMFESGFKSAEKTAMRILNEIPEDIIRRLKK